MGKGEKPSVNVRVSEHRARLREQGMRPQQVWVDDLSNPQVVDELRDFCRSINSYDGSADDESFVYALAADE